MEKMIKAMSDIFSESIQTKQKILDGDYIDVLFQMGVLIASAIEKGNKLMLCGNGGSAADAQHLAAELLVRLRPSYNRKGIPAIALAQDTSTITACGNDFGYDQLYERMTRSLGKKGDVLIGITTSGRSENVLKALQAAREMEIITFGFLGAGGGKAVDLCDKAFVVPSDSTGRIQEMHITAGHALMECVEDILLENNYLSLDSIR